MLIREAYMIIVMVNEMTGVVIDACYKRQTDRQVKSFSNSEASLGKKYHCSCLLMYKTSMH